MKIIAHNNLHTATSDETSLPITNDMELATLIASGALEGVQRIDGQRRPDDHCGCGAGHVLGPAVLGRG